MRIYDDCRELMSEMGRDLWEMGKIVSPKTYQNKVIEGKEEFKTKELICKQYCLMSLQDSRYLFAYTKAFEWAAAESRERKDRRCLNPGEAYKFRKELWEEFLNEDGKFDYTYGERFNQKVVFAGKEMAVLEAIARLLASDRDTRKAVLPVFGGYRQLEAIEKNSEVVDAVYSVDMDIDGYDGTKRIPCSMYYDFLIRDGKLHICYHQRSSDFIAHFGNDVYLAWELKEYMTNLVNHFSPDDTDIIEPGYLYHTIDSLHAYQKDWVWLKTSIDDIMSTAAGS